MHDRDADSSLKDRNVDGYVFWQLLIFILSLEKILLACQKQINYNITTGICFILSCEVQIIN